MTTLALERYRLRQNGQTVASVEGVGARAVIREYATVYSGDGPVEIEEFKNGRWRGIR